MIKHLQSGSQQGQGFPTQPLHQMLLSTKSTLNTQPCDDDGGCGGYGGYGGYGGGDDGGDGGGCGGGDDDDQMMIVKKRLLVIFC